MSYLIQNRKPASVFRFFEDLCAIPHPSYHEEKIADYLCAFAADRGLACYRDDLHNVLIKKPATPDMADRAPLLFQGHTDMVCVKTADSTIDFMKDGLSLYIDGDFLRAKGTTLGADDGIAVATMLALLDGELPSHPALECLFTSAEEVGLDGAEGFDYSHISARKMINMDSEDLGIITAGCAGGLRSTLTKTCARVPVMGECLKVSLQGLFGGHSGVDICSGRANANKLMGRLLAKWQKAEGEAHLVSLNGGSKDNAIPSICEAVIVTADAEKTTALIEQTAAEIAAENENIISTAAVKGIIAAAPDDNVVIFAADDIVIASVAEEFICSVTRPDRIIAETAVNGCAVSRIFKLRTCEVNNIISESCPYFIYIGEAYLRRRNRRGRIYIISKNSISVFCNDSDFIFSSKNLIFDLVVPISYDKEKKKEVCRIIRRKMYELDSRYQCVIQVENSFVAEDK